MISPRDDNGERILIVNDDPNLQRVIAEILEKEGYELLLADGSGRAMDLLHQQPVDLILLDIVMPDLSGYDVCRRLREIPATKELPVIFLTAMDGFSSRIEGYEAGGVDYVPKPLIPSELLLRIRTHLSLRRSSRDMREKTTILDAQLKRLDQVRSGQERLLADPADYPEINAAVRFQPTLEAGGDFYDILKLSDEDFGFLVCDVSGHDLGIAYLTGAMKALSVSFTSEALSVQDTAVMLNAALRKFLDYGQYVSACYVKFSKTQMLLDVINAGHPAPFFAPHHAAAHFLDLVGDVLGIHETVTCQTSSFKVHPGDRLFLYTDGLTESWPNSNGKCGSRILGSTWLAKQVNDRSHHPLSTAVHGIVDEMLSAGQGRVDDDVILMGIEF